MTRTRDELAATVAAILADEGVQEPSDAAQRVVDDILASYRVRRREPLNADRERERHRRDEQRIVAANAKTIDTARNRYQDWTSHELDVLSREDLSNLEVANMLGRTLFGVKQARKRLKHGIPGKRGDAPRWTGPELELAARKDLTSTQVAKMIGRSPNAVDQIRSKMRRDPRKYLLAGISERTS